MKTRTSAAALSMQRDFDADFARLEASFELVAQIASPVKREFTLNRLAGCHELPKSEFRRLYRLWCVEVSSQEGEA